MRTSFFPISLQDKVRNRTFPRLDLPCSMADSWLSQIRSNPHLKDPEPQAAMTTIHDVVVERLSPLDAARQISSTYEPALRQGHSGLWSLWTIINSAITNLGGDTDILQRLAQMLIQLSRLPNIVDDSGRPLKSPSGRKIWQELPDFSFYFFEEAIGEFITVGVWPLMSRSPVVPCRR